MLRLSITFSVQRASFAMLMAAMLVWSGAAAGAASSGWPTDRPAQLRPQASTTALLAATLTGAGNRIVAVGDHGVILLSDDGKTYRQARSVPTRTMLTTVFFIDRQTGWAAGHDGVVLKTVDGGDTWRLLRQQYGQEQPILSIWFADADNGLAVGLFGMALRTADGGVTWREVKLTDGDAADRHLYRILATHTGTLLITAEAGTVFRSEDGGKHWDVIDTGEKGSLWSATAFAENGVSTVVMVGMRGHIIRSADDGKSWQAIASGTTQSLTDADSLSERELVVGGMGGTLLRSNDGGRHFVAVPGAGDAPITALVKMPGAETAPLALFSLGGVLPPLPRAALQ
ncbi:BNR/Asp-box repeat family protein [Collimonas arenae]|uniref:BNR/Asp-box repeat family protein n=1 Tax=Collimonas arenae TaxID=279058 RepID=A0A127PK16_9BURK|nr:YCF48-related protein [Collimonas arenae]AMO98128.1 BNR/Asp-box repeat family protein [Collimonas arenae]AMP07997.1 BNR/Asp-box repeat family protein [Collimonas arenae]